MFFENPLKPETIPTIKRLKAANVDNIMITGDNLFTALNVGVKSGFVEVDH